MLDALDRNGGPQGRGSTVTIVGGGLIGLTVGHRLARAGVRVRVYERDKQLGGLAGSTNLGGIPVDRYYHVALPTDERVRELAGEVGIAEDRFRFRRTGGGFYQAGRLSSISSARELLTFHGLRRIDRLRLGLFAARCQLKSGYDDLEDVALEDWLRRTCGDRLWEDLWRPLLDSKFDGRFDDLPATYLWARSRRMAATRDRSSKEVMGVLDGGYQVLADALADSIRAHGGEVHTSTPVTAIVSCGGRAVGVATPHGFQAADWVVSTLLRTHADALLDEDLLAAVGPDTCRYLGVVCLVMRVRRSISPYYLVNITDRRVPLTTVVETTHVVDRERVGGTLVYAPKYVQPDSSELDRSSADVRETYLEHVRTMFPRLRRDDVLATQVARARHAEPIHVLGGKRRPDMFPAEGLALASSAHVYPELVNAQAVIGVADRLVAGLLERIEVGSRAAGLGVAV